MNKRFILSEQEREEIRKKYFFEQKTPKQERFCHKGNVKSLDEVLGEDKYEDYIEGIQLRKNGVRGLIDHLEQLKNIRNHTKITDGGKSLSLNVMNILKGFKPYNYFEEQTKECNRAMDKIVELYKENEHGEELVRDIEKVMSNHHQLEPQANEFLKLCLDMIKGQ